jgi:3-hydroxymyristoyl/3-hydroxydecanoyl-(acyl carrier protein) dehydratase
MIDKVLTIVPGSRIVTIKNVTMEATYFEHHFPGIPLLPGVLAVEALAQASGYLLLRSTDESEMAIAVVLTGIHRARLLRPIKPGDQLVVEAQLERSGPHVATTLAKGSVKEEIVVRARLSFGMRAIKGEQRYQAVVDHARELRRILEDDVQG